MSIEKKNALNVLQFRTGVNHGDHAETVVSAHEVREGETVADLADRLLTRERSSWKGPGAREVEDGWRIEIRLAEPVDKEVSDGPF